MVRVVDSALFLCRNLVDLVLERWECPDHKASEMEQEPDKEDRHSFFSSKGLSSSSDVSGIS